MLKRYQVLLSDWIEDYIKLICEKYDISFSAAIRINLCLGILYSVSSLYPEYKINFKREEFQEYSNKATKNELEEAEVHKMASKILFETRKSVEYVLSKQKELIKK